MEFLLEILHSIVSYVQLIISNNNVHVIQVSLEIQTSIMNSYVAIKYSNAPFVL